MNAYTNQYQQRQYQQNHIYTATQEQILIMLYDGAIRFTRQAIMAGEQGNQAEKLGRISKTLAIITEFSNTLNHEIGGKIAADLDGLYQFMIRELNAARKDESGEKLKTVERLLVDLRETWGQAIDINHQQQEDATSASEQEAQKAQLEKVYTPLNAAG
ncbi:MAG: flagellar export chaperone FliS [Proteobacteria bacterium]|nr:flagellar export chaperone FliS [Pseudomonadota bacterium]MBU1649814.1 flagellar export chaperone FliS [Pseudomonadota bacterium]MBU1986351.1 flagellar export chaperone FliS [Pseudomonadota bacterium]